jgi:peroxiredoxin
MSRIAVIRRYALLLVAASAVGVASAVADDAPGVRATLQSVSDRAPASAFKLDNGAGKSLALSDYRGKVVVLDFWATECGGCVKEIPWFIALAHKHEAAGLVAVGVSMEVQYSGLKNTDEGWNRVTPWVQSHRVDYPVVMADDGVVKAYEIQALPVTYLLDRNGRIAATYAGLVDRENIEANIQALLKE